MFGGGVAKYGLPNGQYSFHQLCTCLRRFPAKLALIRSFSGTSNRIYTEEQRRFDVGFPRCLRSLDAKGENVHLNDFNSLFLRFSPRCRLAVFFELRQIATKGTKPAILLQGA